ncbi:hypothetical protein [Sphingobacterium sp. IITKGP-BTPF85]|uniref:hypothetical protein n=1 Tax=Sphingobacterium sp. IITKGP-BTPF85 TaxID=1338009 RepID=UPI00038A28D4|nr:hypothetical protein [Sphingobacterium sp. IITKGP-BTPF85]KKX49378.1 hypothetical protein L950_0216065 [Sphingobacterium sp. IITKGP-BTPF85]
MDKLKRLNTDITEGIRTQIEILKAQGGQEKEIYNLSIKEIRIKRGELEEVISLTKNIQLKNLNN